MTDILPQPADQTTHDGAPITAAAVVEAVYDGFSAKNRERISREDVARVVAELELAEERPRRKSPALRVRRLRFAGEKRLRDRSPEPFGYDQAFAPGVNVICIPDNEVGKSSMSSGAP